MSCVEHAFLPGRGATDCPRCGEPYEVTARADGTKRTRCRPCQKHTRPAWLAKQARESTPYAVRRRAASRARIRRIRRNIPTLRERDGDDCCICHGPLDFTDLLTIHVEHRWPRALRGDDRIENLALAHAPCNIAKGDRVDEALTAWARSEDLLCPWLHGYGYRRWIEVRLTRCEAGAGVEDAPLEHGGPAHPLHPRGASDGPA